MPISLLLVNFIVNKLLEDVPLRLWQMLSIIKLITPRLAIVFIELDDIVFLLLLIIAVDIVEKHRR